MSDQIIAFKYYVTPSPIDTLLHSILTYIKRTNHVPFPQIDCSTTYDSFYYFPPGLTKLQILTSRLKHWWVDISYLPSVIRNVRKNRRPT